MSKALFKSASILVLSSLFVAVHSREVIDPQVLAQQELDRKRMEETGYADIELDNLHAEIKALLPKIITLLNLEKGETNRLRLGKNEEGKYVLSMEIAFGESIKSISERYIYTGKAELETDPEGKSLKSITYTFERVNPLGINYRQEKRVLINPTPNFTEDRKTLDRNDDIKIQYYVMTNPKEGFQKVKELTINQIEYFPKRTKLLETYKKYLRRIHRKLKKKYYDLQLTQRVRVQEMLEFE